MMRIKNARRKRNGVGKRSGIKKKNYRRRKTDVNKLLSWDTAAGVKAKEYRIVRNNKDLKAGLKLYAHMFPNDYIPTDAVHFWKLVKSSNTRFSLSKHRKTYLKAVAAAYAIYEHISQSQAAFAQHINVMGGLTGNRPTSPHAIPVRMALQLVIDYADTDNDDGISRIDYKRLSRDALAVQWLIGEGVAACEVVTYQKENGGGLHRWSTLANRSGDVTTAKGAQAKAMAAIDARCEKRAAEIEHYYDDTEPSEKLQDKVPVTERQICKFIALKYQPGIGESVIVEFVGTRQDVHVRMSRTRIIGGTGIPGQNRILVEKAVGRLFGADTKKRN